MRIAPTASAARNTRPASVSSRYSTSVWPDRSRSRLAESDEPSLLCERLLDDAAWIDRVNRGDEDAASALVERLRPTVLKCIHSRLPRWASQEDLVQTVFAKVFAKLHQFSGSVPLEHWVSRIAINTTLNQLSYEALRPELSMSDLSEEQEAALQNTASKPTQSEEREQAREALDLLFAHLQPDEKKILVLLYLERRSTLEISRLTGLSISLVKVRAFRTRHKLRKLGERLLIDWVP